MSTYGKEPETVRAIVEDRWDQATTIAEPSIRDSSSGIDSAPIYDQLDEILHMLGAVVAGGEVGSVGLRSVTDEIK